MKVLVTGGCGFLGSHVCQFYRDRGDSVISYDNLTKYELERVGYGVDSARRYNWDYLDRLGVCLVKEDIRDYDTLMQHARGVDFIIHTAAQPAMTISLEDPKLDFTTNVLGTFNLLNVANELKIPIVSCSTIHVYGNRINQTLSEQSKRYVRNPVAIDEDHRVVEGTLTPLHASKRAAEIYLETYIHSYKLQAASFRLTGLYGPRQFGGEDHGWVANFAIRSLMERPLRIFGTGKQVRDIIYPTDVVRAFHAFYERGEPGIYNIGGGPEFSISLLECIDLIGDILGVEPRTQYEQIRLGDLLYFICDIGKAQRILKWSPKIPPREGIEDLIKWINENRELFRKDIA